MVVSFVRATRNTFMHPSAIRRCSPALRPSLVEEQEATTPTMVARQPTSNGVGVLMRLILTPILEQRCYSFTGPTILQSSPIFLTFIFCSPLWLPFGRSITNAITASFSGIIFLECRV